MAFMRPTAYMTSAAMKITAGQGHQMVPLKSLLGNIAKFIQFSLIHAPP